MDTTQMNCRGFVNIALVIIAVLFIGAGVYITSARQALLPTVVSDNMQVSLRDEVIIAGTARVSYGEGATYDLLPSGDTGFYWANGILVSSTLAQ